MKEQACPDINHFQEMITGLFPFFLSAVVTNSETVSGTRNNAQVAWITKLSSEKENDTSVKIYYDIKYI